MALYFGAGIDAEESVLDKFMPYLNTWVVVGYLEKITIPGSETVRWDSAAVTGRLLAVHVVPGKRPVIVFDGLQVAVPGDKYFEMVGLNEDEGESDVS